MYILYGYMGPKGFCWAVSGSGCGALGFHLAAGLRFSGPAWFFRAASLRYDPYPDTPESTLLAAYPGSQKRILRLMDKILHDPKDPKLWELWYIPYNG